MVVQFESSVLQGLSRNEMFLLFQVVARANENGVASLSMKDMQKITSWHYEQVLANTRFLVEKGLIHNIPTDDRTGLVKVEYRILTSLVSLIPEYA